MSNKISDALRELASRVDNELPDARSLVIGIGDSDGLKLSGYYGNIEPAHDVAIHMLANCIIEMNTKRADELEGNKK